MSRVRTVRAGDVFTLQRRAVDVVPEETYREIGVRSFSRGIFHKPLTTGDDIGSKRIFHIRPGDLVVSNIFAWEGAVAVADESCDGTVGSHRFMTWLPSDDVDAHFISHYFASDAGLSQLRAASPGSAGRNRTLSIKNFEAIEIPLPPLPDQRRIAAHLDSVAERSGSLLDRGGTALSFVEAAWLGQAYAFIDSWKTMGEAGSIARGSTPKLSIAGAPFVGQAAVRWGSLDLSRAKRADDEWVKSVRNEKRTRVGDLLLNSTGEGTIGRAAVVDSSTEGLVTDSKVLTIRPGDIVDSTYLALYLRSPEGQAAIESAKGANTNKQTELGVERCRRLPVPGVGRAEKERVVHGWSRFNVAMERAQALSQQRAGAVAALLPAARNEVFSALR